MRIDVRYTCQPTRKHSRTINIVSDLMVKGFWQDCNIDFVPSASEQKGTRGDRLDIPIKGGESEGRKKEGVFAPGKKGKYIQMKVRGPASCQDRE